VHWWTRPEAVDLWRIAEALALVLDVLPLQCPVVQQYIHIEHDMPDCEKWKIA
jgi:hypothetical protein